jgi:adenylate cyclase
MRRDENAVSNRAEEARAPASGDALGELPERVKAVIREQDRNSERLLGLVQLGIGLLFALVYMIAPRPEDAHASMFSPVPVALAGFIVFSALRLWLIMRAPVPGWFVALSIFADTALLLGLIWSFHLQYGQPPAFSLKAPTLIYIFVFIALRSLRFDPRYVLAAGLAAAVGWLVVTLAAIYASEPETITRSFGDYILGNRILIGAEVDKILAILLVTGLLAFGVERAKRTLITAIREETAGREVRRFLSRGVADAIARSETLVEPGQATERRAAIMMLDIRGFTRFSTTVSPREVVDMLTSFHARIVPIVRGNNGVIDKFLGDGVMATFGAVEPTQAPAADALNALEAILDEARSWKDELARRGIAVLSVNGSVTSGTVVFATLGNEDRLEYTVIGEAVNLAAKLEKHNKVEGSLALVPAATLVEAMRQGFRARVAPRPRTSVAVAGVPAPIDLFAFDVR